MGRKIELGASGPVFGGRRSGRDLPAPAAGTSGATGSSDSTDDSNSGTSATTTTATSSSSSTGGATSTTSGSTSATTGAVLPPDDGWIAYLSDATGVVEVYVARDDGSRTVQLTQGLSNSNVIADRPASWPRISWDGTQVAVISHLDELGDDSSSRVWVMNIAGSDRRVVTDTGDLIAQGIAWTPDSQRLIYVPFEVCSENFVAIDVDNPLSTELLYERGVCPAAGRGSRPRQPRTRAVSRLVGEPAADEHPQGAVQRRPRIGHGNA